MIKKWAKRGGLLLLSRDKIEDRLSDESADVPVDEQSNLGLETMEKSVVNWNGRVRRLSHVPAALAPIAIHKKKRDEVKRKRCEIGHNVVDAAMSASQQGQPGCTDDRIDDEEVNASVSTATSSGSYMETDYPWSAAASPMNSSV